MSANCETDFSEAWISPPNALQSISPTDMKIYDSLGIQSRLRFVIALKAHQICYDITNYLEVYYD